MSSRPLWSDPLVSNMIIFSGSAPVRMSSGTVGVRCVLEVHRAEARLEHLHELDRLVRVVLAFLVVAVDAERHAVDAAEVLHQEGLALHHAQTARRGDVAVAQNARGI